MITFALITGFIAISGFVTNVVTLIAVDIAVFGTLALVLTLISKISNSVQTV